MVVHNITNEDLLILSKKATVYTTENFGEVDVGGIKVEVYKNGVNHVFYIRKKDLPVKLSNKVITYPVLFGGSL